MSTPIEIGEKEFEEISTGQQQFFIDHQCVTHELGELLHFSCNGQSTTAFVQSTCPIVTDVAVYQICGLARVWSHADGDANEEIVTKIEDCCARARLFSHVGYESQAFIDVMQEIGEHLSFMKEMEKATAYRRQLATRANHYADHVQRPGVSTAAPVLSVYSTALNILDWLRWAAPDSRLTGYLALADFKDAAVILEAWATVEQFLLERSRDKGARKP